MGPAFGRRSSSRRWAEGCWGRRWDGWGTGKCGTDWAAQVARDTGPSAVLSGIAAYQEYCGDPDVVRTGQSDALLRGTAFGGQPDPRHGCPVAKRDGEDVCHKCFGTLRNGL